MQDANEKDAGVKENRASFRNEKTAPSRGGQGQFEGLRGCQGVMAS
jgi:hypothetical protein